MWYENSVKLTTLWNVKKDLLLKKDKNNSCEY